MAATKEREKQSLETAGITHLYVLWPSLSALAPLWTSELLQDLVKEVYYIPISHATLLSTSKS